MCAAARARPNASTKTDAHLAKTAPRACTNAICPPSRWAMAVTASRRRASPSAHESPFPLRVAQSLQVTDRFSPPRFRVTPRPRAKSESLLSPSSISFAWPCISPLPPLPPLPLLPFIIPTKPVIFLQFFSRMNRVGVTGSELVGWPCGRGLGCTVRPRASRNRCQIWFGTLSLDGHPPTTTRVICGHGLLAFSTLSSSAQSEQRRQQSTGRGSLSLKSQVASRMHRGFATENSGWSFAACRSQRARPSSGACHSHPKMLHPSPSKLYLPPPSIPNPYHCPNGPLHSFNPFSFYPVHGPNNRANPIVCLQKAVNIARMNLAYACYTPADPPGLVSP